MTSGKNNGFTLSQIGSALILLACGIGAGLLAFTTVASWFPAETQRWLLMPLVALTLAAFYFSSRYYDPNRTTFNGWLLIVVILASIIGFALGFGPGFRVNVLLLGTEKDQFGINWGDFIVQVTATLIGAFAGAYFAYMNERHKAGEDELRARAGAVNLAIHTLGNMYAIYQTYKSQVVDPHRSDPNNWYLMRPTDLFRGEMERFDYRDLQFLFRSSNPNVLSKMAMVARNFVNTRDLAARRAVMHMTELQPAVEKTGKKESHTSEFVEAAIGLRVTYTMKEYTRNLITNVDYDIGVIEETQKELIAAAKPLIGNQRVIRFLPNVVGLTEVQARDKLAGL